MKLQRYTKTKFGRMERCDNGEFYKVDQVNTLLETERKETLKLNGEWYRSAIDCIYLKDELIVSNLVIKKLKLVCFGLSIALVYCLGYIFYV